MQFFHNDYEVIYAAICVPLQIWKPVHQIGHQCQSLYQVWIIITYTAKACSIHNFIEISLQNLVHMGQKLRP